MKKKLRIIGIIMILLIIGLLVMGCEIIVELTPTVTSVTIDPSTVNVAKGRTRDFNVTVEGENSPAQTVTWSIVETNKHAGTTIDANGLLTVSAGEQLTSLTVKATSTVDTSKSGTAAVSVLGGFGPPTITSVTIDPSTANISKGGTKDFNVVVAGENNPSQNVTWEIVETTKQTGTTIDANGLLTVSASEVLTSLTVKATSVADITKSGTAVVTVTNDTPIATVISVTVDPLTANLGQGGKKRFNAVVTGENNPTQTVKWSIDEINKNAETTLDENGSLTVSAEEALTTLTIRATSTLDDTKSGTATVTVAHYHVESEDWIYNAAQHWKECISNDGEKMQVTNHSPTWFVDTSATYVTGGSRHKKCTVCEYVLETEIRPILLPRIISSHIGDMIGIIGGQFDYGGISGKRNLKLSSFYIGKYEVTQAQYKAVMDGNNPSYFTPEQERPAEGTEISLNRPVENVSWYDVVEFCNVLSIKEGLTPAYTINKEIADPNNHSRTDTIKWLVTMNVGANGYRLPTEAEWEYACRAGTSTTYYTGDTEDDALKAAAWYAYTIYTDDNTHEVGMKTPNEWGLYDMHGNVNEWCWDWSSGTGFSNEDDYVGPPDGSSRVMRGGSWNDPYYSFSSSHSFSHSPYGENSRIGFRLVRSRTN
ncbi:MAG: SUMF1/EgtB/PvdO family nonheme iron enzyme [Treponema sp.]|jgi:formylglycine-generating enzyme required for sulfatase activity|nr:SUMF1/EgtB/PvdO family nonheme iron enzyme [Treponema sp.]